MRDHQHSWLIPLAYSPLSTFPSFLSTITALFLLTQLYPALQKGSLYITCNIYYPMRVNLYAVKEEHTKQKHNISNSFTQHFGKSSKYQLQIYDNNFAIHYM